MQTFTSESLEQLSHERGIDGDLVAQAAQGKQVIPTQELFIGTGLEAYFFRLLSLSQNRRFDEFTGIIRAVQSNKS